MITIAYGRERGYTMNKLYIIRFKLSNGYVISTWSGWTEAAALDKIRKNPEWTFAVAENNEIHKIWDAR